MIDPDVIRPERLRPLSRAEYDRMVEFGAFADERVELLYGMLVTMSPQGSEHAFSIQELIRPLVLALGERARVRIQLPLALSEESEPEPDVAVVPLGDYRKQHPSTALLVVEVAKTSLRDDRLIKGRLYAEAGIPEYWLVDVVGNRVERYLDPRDGRYTRLSTHGPEEALALVVFPDVTVRLGEILAG
jgi:Uma2 family endonuclease